VMNVLLPEINDNPFRREAAPAFNPIVEENINKKTKEFVIRNFKDPNIEERLFNDLGDYFTFDQSMRAWNPMPSSTIPNDQKAFTEYVIRENLQKRKPNLSFLKIIPFTLVGKTTISQEDIKTELEKFEKIEDISFQFLNSAVEKMTFGIEKLIKFCQCGLEIHTPMTFPNGPSAIFIIHDAFDQFIKK
jgi:hypothetical protein